MNRLSLSPLLVFALLGHGTCSMVNRTIDDKYGDEVTGQVPLYTPSKGWAEGSNCNGCGISVSGGVDPHGPFNGTWHDTTVHPHDPSHTIALNFTGSAVYVFNMIANRVNHVSTETHITFFIDDEKVGQYDHTSDNTTEFHYQVPVYTNISMPYKEHSLKIVADGTQLSLVLFDYVKYTTKADNISVASAVTSSLDSPTTVRTSLSQTTISSSTSPHPATTRTSTSSYPTTDTIVTYTGPPDLSSQTSVPSPTPLQRGDSKHLATVAGLTAALSFLCGMAALGIFRTRKSIMLCLRRARGRGRGSQGHTRVYPAGSSSSSAQSSLDVNFSNSRSTLIRLGSPASPSSISYVPSTPQYTFLREPPPVRQYRGGPVTYPDVPTRHRSSPPTHSVDVPRSAVSSSRTGTDQSSGSISELRRELRSLREKLRELQSPRKHRLRLADGHSAGPGRGSSEVGVPVSLETLQEDV
ncbi:hypothetical protein V8D89_006442 [Ganoderma adspersum]